MSTKEPDNGMKTIGSDVAHEMWESVFVLETANRLSISLLASVAAMDGYVANFGSEIPFWKEGVKCMMLPCGRADNREVATVSYTHLTLPTIYAV